MFCSSNPQSSIVNLIEFTFSKNLNSTPGKLFVLIRVIPACRAAVRQAWTLLTAPGTASPRVSPFLKFQALQSLLPEIHHQLIQNTIAE